MNGAADLDIIPCKAKHYPQIKGEGRIEKNRKKGDDDELNVR
jgi:hypothetical protein